MLSSVSALQVLAYDERLSSSIFAVRGRGYLGPVSRSAVAVIQAANMWYFRSNGLSCRERKGSLRVKQAWPVVVQFLLFDFDTVRIIIALRIIPYSYRDHIYA